MKPVIISLIGGVALCGTINSCRETKATSTPQVHEIRGQVFIIQNNGVNVKMGGLDIHFVPDSDFREKSNWIAINLEKSRHLTTYKLRMEAMMNRLQSVEQKEYASEIIAFLTDMRQLRTLTESSLAQQPAIQELFRIRDWRDENMELFRNSAFSGFQDQQWAVTSIFFDWRNEVATVSTVTDADGNYTLKAPFAQRGYILAQASRLYGIDEVEHYFWIQEVDGQNADAVHLNSNNALTPHLLDKLLRFGKTPIRSSPSLVASEFGLPNIDWFNEAEGYLAELDRNQNEIDNFQLRIRDLKDKIEEVKNMSEP